jgi:hypothetical protein
MQQDHQGAGSAATGRVPARSINQCHSVAFLKNTSVRHSGQPQAAYHPAGRPVALPPPVVNAITLQFPDHRRPLLVFGGATAFAKELFTHLYGALLNFFRGGLKLLIHAQHIHLILAGRFHPVHPKESFTNGFANRQQAVVT